jgi:hypothetical protein
MVDAMKRATSLFMAFVAITAIGITLVGAAAQIGLEPTDEALFRADANRPMAIGGAVALALLGSVWLATARGAAPPGAARTVASVAAVVVLVVAGVFTWRAWHPWHYYEDAIERVVTADQSTLIGTIRDSGPPSVTQAWTFQGTTQAACASLAESMARAANGEVSRTVTPDVCSLHGGLGHVAIDVRVTKRRADPNDLGGESDPRILRQLDRAAVAPETPFIMAHAYKEN